MIQADAFLDATREAGVDFFTGVPCSFLTPFINRAIGSPSLDYVGAASEGEAVAIAAGAYLAGRVPAVMCQNSGLGNMVNPLTSLNDPFRIPALLIATWRGQPGLKDEPQHALMGEITQGLFGLMRSPHRPFPKTEEEIGPALEAALGVMRDEGRPFALVMEKGAVADSDLADTPQAPRAKPGVRDFRQGAALPKRTEVLSAIRVREAAHPIVATTGKTGRELFTIGDTDNQLYLVGSMGGAVGVGLGVARCSGKRTVVLDGDGAALMKMGSFATVGAYAPEGLVHVLLDNGVHDSTGGQATVSAHVDFAAVAAACGYASAARCDSVSGLEAALAETDRRPGPHFLHVRIAPGSPAKLGRPTVPPHRVAQRFRAFVAGGTG